MLAKVIKYEGKAARRLLLPLFCAALALGGLSRLLTLLAQLVWQPAGFFFTSLGNVLGLVLFIGVVAAVSIYVLVRFWQGMMGAEASLTFSLPVTAGAHIWGRFVVHTLYFVLGFCVAIACLFLTIPSLAGLVAQMPFQVQFFGESGGNFTLGNLPGASVANLILFILIAFLVAVVTNLFKFYASFAIGSQMRERLLGSVVGFIVLNVIEGLLLLPVLLVPLFSIGNSTEDFIRFSQSITNEGLMDFMWLVLAGACVYCLVCTVAHAIITQVCFGRRVNVE